MAEPAGLIPPAARRQSCGPVYLAVL